MMTVEVMTRGKWGIDQSSFIIIVKNVLFICIYTLVIFIIIEGWDVDWRK